MIQLTTDTRILLATRPADFRCGIDGFAALCRRQLAREPRSGTLFVFINRRKTMVRALTYDGSGFWLMTKRLSKGTFPDWPGPSQAVTQVAAKRLKALLSGAPGWQKV